MPTRRAAEQEALPARSESLLAPVRAIFRALVSTVVPEAVKLDAQSWAELEWLIDDTLRERPAALRRQLRWLLRAIEWLPVCRYGRPFTALDVARRQGVLSYLQDHRLELVRTGFWGLRTLAFLGYYGRARAQADIGYRADRRGWGALP